MASLPVPPPDKAQPPTAVKPKDEAVDRKGAQIRIVHSPSDTLEARCRSVISANLERYPAKALGVLSEEMWDSIVRDRNIKTRPNGGTGGLDGTGRLLPAISDRFMTQVEESNPHFADSAVADRLAWKDCVEYRFRSGGLTRPAALKYPYPVLVNKLKRSGEILIELLNSDKPSDRNQELFELHVQALSDSLMNVSLLQASGVGKSVKKFIKTCVKRNPSSLDVHTARTTKGSQSAVSPLVQLEQTLQRWKQMAANSGVQIQTSDGKDSKDGNESDDQHDMRLLETCQSWRQLFVVLQQREEKRRAEQGERMRKIRKNLASGRPRIIKVRPTKSRHDNILEKTKESSSLASSSSSASASGNAKMQALKKESRIASMLQKSSARPADPRKKHSFGDAVALATNSKPNSSTKRRGGQLVSLGGGKSMRLPSGKSGAKRQQFPGQH